MKKVFSLITVFVLVIISFSACTKNNNTTKNDNNTAMNSTVSSSECESDTFNSDISSGISTDITSSVKSTTSSIQNDSQQNTSSTNTSSKKPATNNTTQNSSLSNTTNSSSTNSTTSSSSPDSTIGNPIGELANEMDVYQYNVDGIVLDWFTEEDFVYTIFENKNYFVVFDSRTGEIVIQQSLGGRPAKMRNYGDELWISYPDLQCIKIYDKATFSQKSTISLSHPVNSFDVYNDYLIYSEDDQHVEVYRYNMKTSESVELPVIDGRFTFYEAAVLVNKEHGVLYVGESGSTGADLFCYDIETLEIIECYKYNSYGYANAARTLFLLNNRLYWGEFAFDSLDISAPIGQYSSRYSAGMLHVDELFVVTSKGLYINETYELLLRNEFPQWEMMLITESGNIFVISDYNEAYICVPKAVM